MREGARSDRSGRLELTVEPWQHRCLRPREAVDGGIDLIYKALCCLEVDPLVGQRAETREAVGETVGSLRNVLRVYGDTKVDEKTVQAS